MYTWGRGGGGGRGNLVEMAMHHNVPYVFPGSVILKDGIILFKCHGY